MNVAILTEGGRDIGLGHIARSMSLHAAFGVRGIRPRVLANGDDSIRDDLEGSDHAVFDWRADGAQLHESIRQADIVVIDSYLAGKDVYEAACRAGDLGVYFDDENRLAYPDGVVINGAINAGRIDYPRRAGLTYLLGARYLTLRREFWDVPRKVIRRRIGSVLVTVGADDPRNLSSQLLAMLTRRYPQLDKNVVVGRFADPGALGPAVDARTRLIHRPGAAHMRQAMLDADIAISAGGQTLCELACVGIPTLTICLGENQRWNLNGWREVGFTVDVGAADGEDLTYRVAKGIDTLLPYAERRRRYEIAREVMAGSRAVNVVDALLARVNRTGTSEFGPADLTIRPATAEDCHELWVWRNHPEVRKWSFQKEEIDYASHRRWFAQKRKSASTRIYMAENGMGLRIGQARFDSVRGRTAVSVSLCPMQFGKGLGNRLIRAATQQFLQERPQIQEVIAEIIESNLASCKAFAKAGYIRWADAESARPGTAIYKFRQPADESEKA